MSTLICRLKFYLSRLFFTSKKDDINRPTIVNVGKGHSLFEFINKFCKGESSRTFAFHRLCSLMRKMAVKTAVIEKIAITHNDIKDECQALYTYFGKQIKIEAYRITFLTEDVSSLEAITCFKNESFLASAIVINHEDPDESGSKTDGCAWQSYLYSAVVTIPRLRNHPKYGDIPLLNNYLHIYKTFNLELNLSKNKKHLYRISGTFFCQQNRLTSVCSHASLRMIINNFSDETITSEDINRIIDANHTTKSFGKKTVAFTEQEFRRVLKKYGYTYELLDFYNNPDINYNDAIYNFIESRCPVLLTFTTSANQGHVVPILGHTLNSDLWRPEAEPVYSPQSVIDVLKSASAWVDHFIIHDDNFGMYFCLPVDTLKRGTLPKDDPTFRALYAIAIIPAEVTTYPDEAKPASSILTMDILKWCERIGIPLDDWSKRLLRRFDNKETITIRTFLVTKDVYFRSLKENDFENTYFTESNKRELVNDLPERFWLSEITLPDLYTANKTKIIDFFYRCDNPKLQDKNDIVNRWIQIRLPGALIKREQNGLLSHNEMSVTSHYPLLRLDREHDVLDW